MIKLPGSLTSVSFSLRVSRAPIILLLVLSSGSFASTANVDAEAIRNALQRWVQAFNNRNADGMMKTWAPDAITEFPGRFDGDYNAIKESAVAGARRTDARRTYSIDIEEIGVSRDLAFVRDTWTLKTVLKNSNDTTVLRNRGIEIWRRQADGNWRIIRALTYGDPLTVMKPTKRATRINSVDEGSSNSSSADQENIGAIREAFQNWTRAYNSKNVDQAMAIWSHSALESIPGLPDTNYNDLRQVYERISSQTDLARTYSIETEEVQVSGGFAFARNVSTLSIHDTKTGADFRRKSKSIEVLQREDGINWKIIRSLSCDDPLVKAES